MNTTASQPEIERLGAIDAREIVYESAPGVMRIVPREPVAVADALYLFNIAQAYRLNHLWVHPTFDIGGYRRGGFYTLAEETGWTVTTKELEPWVMGWHPSVWGTRALAFPALMPWDHARKSDPNWHTTPDARTLLVAACRYRDALGLALRRSPGATSTHLMRAVHSGPRATQLDVPQDQLPPPAFEQTENAYAGWIRALTPAELGRKFVHAYDRNGMYLAACSSLALGVGMPQHLTVRRGREIEPGAWRQVGYWRVLPEVYAADSLAGLLPDPIRDGHQAQPDGTYWLTTPALLAADERGVRFTVREGYAWQESHRYLEPWYKRLRDARAALLAREGDEGARYALAALKKTYTHGLGWLDGSWQREAYAEGHAGVLFRPDWRHAAIATANANLMRACVKFHAASAMLPFAMAFDCCYYVSDDPDPLTARPEGMRIGTALGEWKVAAAGVPLVGAVRAALADPQHTQPTARAFLAAMQDAKQEAKKGSVAHAII